MNGTDETAALAVLERYDLDVTRIQPLATSYNTSFRVKTRGGSRYALRVSPPRPIHRAGSDRAEAAWLDELHRDGVAIVPRFIRTREGADGVELGSRRFAVMTWIDGRPVRDHPVVVREMGAIAARLHGHRSVAIQPSVVPAFDRVVYWEIESRFDELTSAQRSVVDPALERATTVIEALWTQQENPPQLLHGDIGTSNLLASSDGIAVLDFEDLVWGFPVLDLSISIADLRRHHGDPRLEAAFREGYERERPWPDIDVTAFETLVAARWLHQIDLGLNVRNPGLDAYVEDLVARIAALGDR